MLGLVFKHQDFDIKSQKICKQKSGRVNRLHGNAPGRAVIAEKRRWDGNTSGIFVFLF